VKAVLAGLDGVTSVAHEPGSDVFVVKHRGPLIAAAQAADRAVIFRWARRALEKLGQQLRIAKRCNR